MKNQTKIAVTATAIAITSLMITAYHTEPPTSPVSPQIAPVSEVVEMGKAYTPPTATEPIAAEEIAQNSTQIEGITVPANQQEDVANVEKTHLPQPTEKEESTNTPIQTTQTATKQTTPKKDTANTPKNGDTRIVNGQQQGYLIGFGWVDNKGGNICEVANSDGDINKIVGSMD